MTNAPGLSCGAGPRRDAAAQPHAPGPDGTRPSHTGPNDSSPDNSNADGDSREAPCSAAAVAGAAFAAYRAGDPSRLNELVSVTTPILWHTVRSYRLDSATTEDVLQSAWLALVRRAEHIQDPQAVLQWLIVTARREAWRVATAARRTEPSAWDGEEFTAPVAEQPETIVVRSAEDRVLWQHVEALSVRCQQLLRVIAFSDRPDYEAISHALGIPLGSIGPTRGRCLAKLRAALAADATWSA